MPILSQIYHQSLQNVQAWVYYSPLLQPSVGKREGRRDRGREGREGEREEGEGGREGEREGGSLQE